MIDGKILIEKLLTYAKAFLHLQSRDEIYFRNGEIPQFLKDDLEKIPFGEEQIIP